MFKEKEEDEVLLQKVTTLPAYSGCEIMPLAMRLGCSITVSINSLSPGQYFIVTASTPHWHRHNLLFVYMFTYSAKVEVQWCIIAVRVCVCVCACHAHVHTLKDMRRSGMFWTFYFHSTSSLARTTGASLGSWLRSNVSCVPRVPSPVRSSRTDPQRCMAPETQFRVIICPLSPYKTQQGQGCVQVQRARESSRPGQLWRHWNVDAGPVAHQLCDLEGVTGHSGSSLLKDGNDSTLHRAVSEMTDYLECSAERLACRICVINIPDISDLSKALCL